MTLVVD